MGTLNSCTWLGPGWPLSAKTIYQMNASNLANHVISSIWNLKNDISFHTWTRRAKETEQAVIFHMWKKPKASIKVAFSLYFEFNLLIKQCLWPLEIIFAPKWISLNSLNFEKWAINWSKQSISVLLEVGKKHQIVQLNFTENFTI